MKNFKRVLSLALAALMVIGGLVVAPADAKAEGTYTKVTDVSTITAGGNFVVVAELGGKYYAMNAYSGNWVTATEVTIVDGALTTTDAPLMTITSSSDGVQFATITGTTIYGETGGNKLYDSASGHVADWIVSEDGTTNEFQFVLVGTESTETPRYLSFSGGSNLKFRQYKSTSLNNTYDATMVLYKYEGTVEVPEDIELEADATPAQIVNAAYQAMEDGVKVLGTWTLEGVITSIDTAYSSQFGNITVTMQVGDMEDKPIQCYRLTGTGIDTLAVGDTITVEGTLDYYGTKVQFAQGSTLKAVEKPEGAPENIELEADATPEEIVNAAYQAKEEGVKLLGTWELQGVITSVDTAYSSQFGNITVTIQVGDMEDKPIQCYRLSGEGVENIGVGDIITVEGTLSYYGEKVQFAQGSTLKAVEEGELENTLPEDATAEEIVDAAYDAMNNNTPMIGEYTLTGVITSIDTEYSEQYGNITVTMVVDGMEDKPIQCYRLAGTGAETLKVGDTITVTGTFGSYNGAVQFNQGSTLKAVVAAGDFSTTGIVVVLFVGVALVAVSVIGKKRMA